MWKDIVTQAYHFMSQQRSPFHFEFFGIDVIADEADNCWLIEINRWITLALIFFDFLLLIIPKTDFQDWKARLTTKKKKMRCMML